VPKAGGTGRTDRKRAPAPAAASAFGTGGPFRLGVFPGAMPGKWVDRWQERRANPLELVAVAAADMRAALDDGLVDAALVRLPIDRDGLHVIALYDETSVVVVPTDSHLTAADELDAADLAGEVVIVPEDDVLRMPLPAGAESPRFAAPPTSGEAIETVAAGVGVVIVPLSLARMHHRGDVEHRLLRGGPASSVALAWIADRTTEDVEAFVGIVRGRTANSSR
jgi:DNA-binding transcriptional LysR family regulator